VIKPRAIVSRTAADLAAAVIGSRDLAALTNAAWQLTCELAWDLPARPWKFGGRSVIRTIARRLGFPLREDGSAGSREGVRALLALSGSNSC
jgi:hypothetical protein